MSTETQLASGRELDALVAEKVMGLCVDCVFRADRFLDASWETLVPPSWVGHDEGRMTGSSVYVVGDITRCTVHDMPLWSWSRHVYSTDIAAAWQVVEKMQTPEMEEWEFNTSTDGDKWEATFWMGDTFNDSGETDTAPHAICLAALRAVEVTA